MIDEMEQQRRISFGNRLRELRESKNLSKVFMARELNISPTSYWQYERGQREPSLKNLKIISQILEVSTDYLLFSADDWRFQLDYTMRLWRAQGFLVDCDYDSKTVVIGRPQMKEARTLSFSEFITLSTDMYFEGQKVADVYFKFFADTMLNYEQVGNPIRSEKFLHTKAALNEEIPF